MDLESVKMGLKTKTDMIMFKQGMDRFRDYGTNDHIKNIEKRLEDFVTKEEYENIL